MSVHVNAVELCQLCKYSRTVSVCVNAVELCPFMYVQ